MNQVSIIPIGTDANLQAGYAFVANDSLGAFDMAFENVGDNTAYLQLRTYDGVSAPSGYVNLGAAFSLKPRATHTSHLVVLSSQVGIFGSGNTVVNASVAIRNKGNLRGAQIDIKTGGRKGWGFDQAFNVKSFTSPGWPAVLP